MTAEGSREAKEAARARQEMTLTPATVA